jgi:hypothetical protein
MLSMILLGKLLLPCACRLACDRLGGGNDGLNDVHDLRFPSGGGEGI